MIESEDDHGYYGFNAAALNKIIAELQFLGGRVKSLADVVKSHRDEVHIVCLLRKANATIMILVKHYQLI